MMSLHHFTHVSIWCAKIYGFWITKNYREAYDMFAVTVFCLTMNHQEEEKHL